VVVVVAVEPDVADVVPVALVVVVDAAAVLETPELVLELPHAATLAATIRPMAIAVRRFIA
jgi:hypothetical protein